MNSDISNKDRSSWSQRVKKRTIQNALWTGAWVGTMALAAFGPKFIWDGDKFFTLAAIIITTLAGFGMIWANVLYLKEQDDMQLKIQLEGMALALGVGIVVGLSYSMLDSTNLISHDAEISHIVIVMSLTYMIGILVGRLRYK